MAIIIPLLIGVVAGLRAMTAPAAVVWAASLGWVDLSTTWASFMGAEWAVILFTVLACVELITDQLPSTPSRKVPLQFGGRLVSGGFTGAVLGAVAGGWIVGLIAGVIGAVVGTYGGAAARAKLAATFGRDRPAALIEDAVAIVGGLIMAAAL